MSERKVAVTAPTPDDYRGDQKGLYTYCTAQSLLALAIQQHGLEMGASHVLSGVTRELRRHLGISEVQEVLRQLADTLPQVVQYDLPD